MSIYQPALAGRSNLNQRCDLNIMGWDTFKNLTAILAVLVFLSASLTPLAHAQLSGPPPPDTHAHAKSSGIEATHAVGHQAGTSLGSPFNHSHPHNPADHSHDTPGIAAYRGQTLPSASNRWRSVVATAQVVPVFFGIERPPRFDR